MQIESVTISGYLVGQIWMPAAECYKPFTYDVQREQARTIGKMTLRDHALRATNDGDFQGCDIAEGVLSVTIRNGRYKRTRHFSLEQFASIEDMRRDNWDGPMGDEE
jgi:hypothetical protein